MARVLVVCTANLCRSPVMERLLAASLGDAVRVVSAGTAAAIGEDLCPRAEAWLRRTLPSESGDWLRQGPSPGDDHSSSEQPQATDRLPGRCAEPGPQRSDSRGPARVSGPRRRRWLPGLRRRSADRIRALRAAPCEPAWLTWPVETPRRCPEAPGNGDRGTAEGPRPQRAGHVAGPGHGREPEPRVTLPPGSGSGHWPRTIVERVLTEAPPATERRPDASATGSDAPATGPDLPATGQADPPATGQVDLRERCPRAGTGPSGGDGASGRRPDPTGSGPSRVPRPVVPVNGEELCGSVPGQARGRGSRPGRAGTAPRPAGARDAAGRDPQGAFQWFVRSHGHLARQLTVTEVERADLILTAGREHRAKVISLVPGARGRTFTLAQAARIAGWVLDGGERPAARRRTGTGTRRTAPSRLPVREVRERLSNLVEELDTHRGAAPRPARPEEDDLPDPHEGARHAATFQRMHEHVGVLLDALTR